MILRGSPLNCCIPGNSFDCSTLGNTLDCDSRMHSFLLLYSLAVLLLVILPGSFFILIVVLPGIPFNFPSQSFRV